MKFKLTENNKFKEFNPVYETANDCYLIAFCACFGITYEDAKRTGISSDLKDIIKVFKQKGYRYNRLDSEVTINDFAVKHSFGTYYLVCRNKNSNQPGHAVALIDGTIYDGTGQNYSNYIVDGYFEVKRISSHLDTSYIDNTDQYKDIATNYAVDKIRSSGNTKDLRIKTTQTGSNSMVLDINGKKANIDIPLNSNAKNTEKLIKKAIDKAF